jgi:hypothetical protein
MYVLMCSFISLLFVVQIPDVELVPIGKQLNLKVRRTQLAKEEIWKAALRAPKRYLALRLLSSIVCLIVWFTSL